MLSLLGKILLLHRIYFRKTIAGIVFDTCFAVVLFAIIMSSDKAYRPMLVPFLVVVAYLAFRSLVRTLLVRRRIATIHYIADTGGMASLLELSAVEDELPDIDHTHLLAEGATWKQYDIEVDHYGFTKLDKDVIKKKVSYTILEVKMRRQVPNIIFDSKRAKGQQFRYLYTKAQRLSLEGNFDGYFQAYAPQHYKVDTLSFISPEVMEALVAACDYDIELVHDRLFLYGPLLLDQSDLLQMQAIGQQLANEIDDNLDTYTDSYLAGAPRHTTTTWYARQLMQSPRKSLIGFTICFTLAVGIIITGIADSPAVLYSDPAIFLYALMLGYGGRAASIIRANKQMEKRFERERAIGAQRPKPLPLRRTHW